ncbi:MAG: hypothetical protein KatS3mg124_0961 [Porticoccaceae bacterium]|nr:MAG: hypothetical protein KatS3mg124_0961 [Porticoccaceae bacterium]
MIRERGTVVAVEPGRVLVETAPAGACGSCGARPGCGHHLLGRSLAGATRIPVAVPPDFPSPLSPGDRVVIGVAEDLLVKSALTLYGVPLLGGLLGAAGGHLALASEGWAALFALVGFAAGAWAARRVAARLALNPAARPVLLAE